MAHLLLAFLTIPHTILTIEVEWALAMAAQVLGAEVWVAADKRHSMVARALLGPLEIIPGA